MTYKNLAIEGKPRSYRFTCNICGKTKDYITRAREDKTDHGRFVLANKGIQNKYGWRCLHDIPIEKYEHRCPDCLSAYNRTYLRTLITKGMLEISHLEYVETSDPDFIDKVMATGQEVLPKQPANPSTSSITTTPHPPAPVAGNKEAPPRS